MFPLFLIVSCIFFIILYYVYDFIIKQVCEAEMAVRYAAVSVSL